jgi:hypothetical protein
MGFLERHGDLPGDGETLFEGKRASAQALGERRTLDKLHDEGADAVAFLEPEDRSDVGVVELGEKLRLALEARQAVAILDESRGDSLDGDLPLEPGVGRAPHLSHPALTKPASDFVRSELRVGGEGQRECPVAATRRRASRRPGACRPTPKSTRSVNRSLLRIRGLSVCASSISVAISGSELIPKFSSDLSRPTAEF